MVTSVVLCAGLAVAGVAATAARSVATGPAPAAASIAARPNVLLILTDDQTRADLAVMSKVKAQIGEQGTTFTRAFSQLPLCCPARASILTGQYAHNNGIMSLHGFADFEKRFGSNNLAVWLRKAGYNTVLLGKYLNGYPGRRPASYVPAGWTEWQAPVRNVYGYHNFTMNENGRLKSYRTYQTTHWQSRGANLITSYARREKPFFMWLSFLAPHWGGPIESDDPRADGGGGLKTPNVANEFRDALSGTRLPPKPSFLEKDMSDKPALPGTGRRAVWEYRELFQQRREALLSVDAAVGKLLDALDRSGEANQTIVIFASDNGYLIGEHRKVGKIVGYEESVGIPMLVRGPGFSSGVRRDQLVSLTDLASTITRAAGISPGLRQDGRPMQPLSINPSAGVDRPILLEAGPRPDRRLYTGIRTPDDRVLLRWRSGATEFYNLGADPFQLNGRVSAGETAKERRALATRLTKLQNCAGSTCWN
jgi:arylsulfatase A-like enzyme